MSSGEEDDNNASAHLICPICLELPDNKIFQCKNGHSICANCCERSKICPQCRVPYKVKVRNRVMEAIVGSMKCRCPYKSNGCTQILRRSELSNHKINCVYNGKCIQFCKLLGLKCEFWTKTNDVSSATVDHLVDIHGFICRRSSSKVKLRLEKFAKEILPSGGAENGTGTEGGSSHCQDSIWTPIILECKFRREDEDDSMSRHSGSSSSDSLSSEDDSDIVTEKFIILCKYHEKDKSLSWWCSLIGGCPKNASKHEIKFRIRSYSKKVPDLVWTVPPSIILQAGDTLPMCPFRIPVESLHKYYVKGDGGLLVTVNILCPVDFEEIISDDDGERRTEKIRLLKTFVRETSKEAAGSVSKESLANAIRNAVSGLNFR